VQPTSALAALFYVPYRAVFYPFLILRRAKATILPASGGTWRTWITDRLSVGGFLAPFDVPTIASEGVRAVVNVTRELWEPRRALEAAGIDYLQVPSWDGKVPSLEDAERGVRFIARHIDEGHKVYVHCASGAGRSVALAICYLVTHEGRDVEEAIATARRLRPRVKLSRTQRDFIDAFIASRRASA
jgi:protein tyrosine phosphatase (PTP) superfamily phosphohydrolase (DUF442 family)